MNSKIRQLIAATTLVAVGSMSIPAIAAEQANTAVVGAQVQGVTQSYVALRSALSAVGVDVQWVNNNGQKIILTYGGQSKRRIVFPRWDLRIQ